MPLSLSLSLSLGAVAIERCVGDDQEHLGGMLEGCLCKEIWGGVD
jgi:hypothetical protein